MHYVHYLILLHRKLHYDHFNVSVQLVPVKSGPSLLDDIEMYKINSHSSKELLF